MAPRSIRSFPGDVQSAGLSVDVLRGRLEPRRGVHSGSVKNAIATEKAAKRSNYLPSEPLVIYSPRASRDFGGMG